MHFNFIAILVAALIPIIMGFVWFHPKTFGDVWKNELGLTEENLKAGNMFVIFGVSFFLNLLLAFETNFFVIHQNHVYSTMMDPSNPKSIEDPSSDVGAAYLSFMESYGSNYRSFKHGALHGLLTGIFFILPVLGINGLFERKKFKFIAVNVGYWTICLILMGGIVCAWV